MRRVYEPAEAAVRVSGSVTGWTADAELQVPAAPDEARSNVPEDGVSCSPDGSGDACQSTDVAVRTAGTTPSCTAVDCPAAIAVVPLGNE